MSFQNFDSGLKYYYSYQLKRIDYIKTMLTPDVYGHSGVVLTRIHTTFTRILFVRY